MAKKICVYDGFYAHGSQENAKGKIVLNGIITNDIYCIKNISNTTDKSADSSGIIAGVGSDDQIKYLILFFLNDKNL